MNGFKFKKVKNKFRWESDFMVLEFSKPSIQGFSDYTILEDEKEIMYYYYTVKIFKKVIKYNKNNESLKWELVGQRNTYDFPSILELKWMLDYQLKDNTLIDSQKKVYTSGKETFSKVICTEGFACDDFYEITKTVNEKGEEDRYIVYAGVTFDPNGDLNSVGIRTPYVERKDIEELLKCVSNFIQYSLDEHNKQVEKYKDNYKIKYNKIYEYDLDENKIESIYIIGDILDITTVIDNKESSYNNVVISKIENNIITLNNGDIIDGNFIVYMNNNPTKEMLKYNEDEITLEFINILEEEEKLEFKNWSVEDLLNKYKMAIIDRTWMCREEHNFDIDSKKGSGVERVTPVVINIIEKIKSSLID